MSSSFAPSIYPMPTSRISSPAGLPAGLPWPEPLIILPNLTIRSYHTNDVASLARHANDPHIARNMPNTFSHPFTSSSASAFIARALAPSRNNVKIWCISLTPTSECIGGCTFEPGPDVFSCNAEIGFWIGQGYWNRGLCTAICRALTDWAFGLASEREGPKLQRVGAAVYGATSTENETVAGKVLKKCGFREEGRMRGMVLKWGEIRDLEVYGMQRGEWEERKRGNSQ